MQHDRNDSTPITDPTVPTSGAKSPLASVGFKVLAVTFALVLVAVGLTELGSVSSETTVGQPTQEPVVEDPLAEAPAVEDGGIEEIEAQDESTAQVAPAVSSEEEAPATTLADTASPDAAEPDDAAPGDDTVATDDVAPAIGQLGAEPVSSSQYIAPNAGTTVPVYDTAWQMLVLASPQQADEYFATLAQYGFTGTWAGVIHHAPATYADPFNGGGTVATFEPSGQVVLTPEYIAHVREILDAADRHGQKVGLVAAWQNLFLPGGGADSGRPLSDTVRGTIHEENSYAYGVQLVEAFGDHPAVSMWVFGGDAGTNNTEANKVVWRNMANGVRDSGSTIDITYHTPTSEFDQLNYAGEEWLDFIAPETGHGQDAATTEAELAAAAEAYQLPVWQGEARYFNINFDWVPANFRNPGVAEVEADAIAARNVGVAGYVYGDAGRWNWCGGFGDSTPCDRNNVAASFGAGEEAVINVFRQPVETEQADEAQAAIEDVGITVDLYEGGTCLFEGHSLESLCDEPGLETVQVIPNR